MKRLKYMLLSLLLLVTVVAPATSASASMVYDDVIIDPVDLVMYESPNCTVDLTADWAEEFRKGLSDANKESFDNRTAWVASVLEADELGGTNYYRPHLAIWWWDASSLPVEATFTPASTGPGLWGSESITVPNTGRYGYLSYDFNNCNLISTASNSQFRVIAGTTQGARWLPFDSYGVSIDYPGGYQGLPLPSSGEASNPRYVAIGDSFSSGEGVPPFEAASSSGCHRSLNAYPRLLQNDTRFNLQHLKFVACSGATTADVMYYGQNGEPKQVDALTSDTEVVTLSVGGNDVSFKDYIIGCVSACGPSTPGGSLVYNAMLGAINAPSFKQNLVYTYEEVLERADNADVYVVDYPYLADEDTEFCVGLDLSGAYSVQTQLNSVIASAVSEVNDARLHLVQTNYDGSPFEGNGLCSTTSMFHHLVLPIEYSIHPMASGQEALKEVVSNYMINN